MANQQTIDKILNKQFKKTAFAGYDPADVDAFFDVVIEYLKSNDLSVEEYKRQMDALTKEKDALLKQIEVLNRTIASKQQMIVQYESEGYGNVLNAKRFSELEQKVKKLEENKNNGK